MTTPPAAHHKVDVFALLTYATGLSGFSSVMTGIVDPSNHILKNIVICFSAISFFAGLALRVFYNQTSVQTATVSDVNTGRAVLVDVEPSKPK